MKMGTIFLMGELCYFGTYGMYTYGMYTYGMYTYGMYAIPFRRIFFRQILRIFFDDFFFRRIFYLLTIASFRIEVPLILFSPIQYKAYFSNKI